MPKTKDAFAFRSFDRERILSRPYFRKIRADYHFADDATDDAILDSLFGQNTLKQLNAAEIEQRRNLLDNFMETVAEFYRLVKKHVKNLRGICDYYAQQFTATEKPEYKFRYNRAAVLWREYNYAEEVTEIFALKFGSFSNTVDKEIQQRYRERFAAILKKTRVAKGMTQRELAKRLRIAPPNVSQYESATIEPTLKNLIRIADILDTSTDCLLGRTCR